TVGVLTYNVARADNVVRTSARTLSRTVPLGRPLPNSRVYILNSHLRPVPVGVAGEVYIGGAGVGRGYLNRPELTAERFIDDIFIGEFIGEFSGEFSGELSKGLNTEPGGRLYRTGDLARYL